MATKVYYTRSLTVSELQNITNICGDERKQFLQDNSDYDENLSHQMKTAKVGRVKMTEVS